ncbi:MAG: phosphoribosylamine--glycine ligase [Propionibacteriaceae bacterium]|nr:phosphoribosylamine--glycine ligase [Propionibacteriaceae bacterium]
MTVLVVGSGGREHALAVALSRDPGVASVHVAPGNPGTWAVSSQYGVSTGSPLWTRISSVDPLDGEQVASLARELGAGLVVIGPEAPLVAGVADRVRAAGIPCFGPSAEAARLEGSKQFAKEVMAAAAVPTARSRYCETAEQAESALDEFGPPYVVKDDHLAAGKGVVVTTDRAEALAHAIACRQVVIEEYLDGPEVSLFVICDGVRGIPLLPAQDFKRVGDADTGPNTGGMGAYCPLPWVPEGFVTHVMDTVVDPVLAEMNSRGTPFQGLLYAGLALTSQGVRVVEFNARFGDPETEAVLPLLQSGLGQVLYAAATGSLTDIPELTWDDASSVVVIWAADGYPGTVAKGGRIAIPALDDNATVIHCGTALDDQGGLVSHGGRVLAVVAQGSDLTAARDNVYQAVDRIDFPTGFHRHDIAQRAAAGLIPTPPIQGQ